MMKPPSSIDGMKPDWTWPKATQPSSRNGTTMTIAIQGRPNNLPVTVRYPLVNFSATLLDFSGSVSLSVRACALTTGIASHAIRNETARLAAMVIESALKNAPVTPDSKASGAKMMIVEKDDPAKGRVNSGHRVNDRLWVFILGAAQAPDNMLDHDDRVVDDKANRCRHTAERHDVETHVHDAKEKHSDREHHRHCRGRDQRDPPASEKQEKNHGGERDADENSVADAAFRFQDDIALIVPIGDMHVAALQGRNPA